jgi:hypothetical protein
MRRYSEVDEEKIRLQDLVREWQRSGLLEVSQAARLEGELRVDLKRVNPFVRAVLFLFSGIVIGASVAFVVVAATGIARGGMAVIMEIAAFLCFAAAEYLVENFRVYRFGIEEACAVAAAVFLPIGIAFATRSDVLAVALATLAAFAVYLRFGYLYAALGTIACAAAISFQFGFRPEVDRVLAALVLAIIFVIVRRRFGRHGIIEAATWAGIYAAVNLQFGFLFHEGLFYWWTYLMIWILPIIGLCIAIREKHRSMLDVNLLMVLVTLATNKPYLRLPRQPWDPILFGVLLISSSIMIRRWLLAGRDGHRYGFTPTRLLAGDLRLLNLTASASSAIQFNTPAATPVEPKPDFGGGRSGGAGASGNF